MTTEPEKRTVSLNELAGEADDDYTFNDDEEHDHGDN